MFILKLLREVLSVVYRALFYVMTMRGCFNCRFYRDDAFLSAENNCSIRKRSECKFSMTRKYWSKRNG